MRWLSLAVVAALTLTLAGLLALPLGALLYDRHPFLDQGPDGERGYGRVIAALERFHDEHGHYPELLDELVCEGFLDALPPSLESPRPPDISFEYEADQDTDFYRLSVSYKYSVGFFAEGFRHRYYFSDRKAWEEGFEDQEPLAAPVAERAGCRAARADRGGPGVPPLRGQSGSDRPGGV
jgi:hypothetical protein